MSQHKRLLVTSALPYANGPIHLGHFAGAYLPADIYVRYQRLQGRDVIYICGTDEYGTAITETARKRGVTAQTVADQYHEEIGRAFERLGMSFDNFSRTSRDVHRRQTQEFFLQLHERGVLKQKTEQQLYDPAIGKFLADRQVRGVCHHCGAADAAGDQCEKCGKAIDPLQLKEPVSVLSGTTPEVRETTHWYFPLGDFSEFVTRLVDEHPEWKSNVLNFCRGYLQEGLQDRAVTRDLDWGVPVPLEGWEGKVLYVWFDAPIGYISSTIEWAERIGQPDRWRDYWCDREGTRLVHFIGKDNIFFHALLFPAMCAAHGDYVIVDEVPANEFLTLEGQKFSTRLGWAVWVHDYLERHDPDPLRYYLTVIMPELSDSDFQWKDYQVRNNAELADTLGNFVQRAVAFAHRYYDGVVPSSNAWGAAEDALLQRVAETADEVGRLLEAFEFKKAVRALMELPQAGNVYFQEQRPWETRKTDPDRCAAAINACLQVCGALSTLMSPFLPFSAEKLSAVLNDAQPLSERRWTGAADRGLPDGHALGEPQILFPKIDDEVIQAELDRLEAAAAAARGESVQTEDEVEQGGTEVSETSEQITIDEFARVQLRVARILSAERIEGADRLLKLQVDLGDEQRQLVAGIAQHYQPEDLPGKQIIVVANLKPAKLRGVESQGMLLAATGEEDVVLLTTERDIAAGTPVS